jgi:transcriptional regulator with XRE-family HTH domain
LRELELKAMRTSKGITQEQMANKLGIWESTYNRKELGLTQFLLNELFKIAIILDMDLNDIGYVFFDMDKK